MENTVKINDLHEFEKMFKIVLPDPSNFYYYVNTCVKSKEYNWLLDIMEDFSEFEEFVENSVYKKIGEYKNAHALPTIQKYIEGTYAYKYFQTLEYLDFKFYKRDLFKINEGNLLFSIDFSNANYNCMKSFDLKKEMGENWNDLLSELGIHSLVAKSKAFRQVVFGNLNPGRNQKIQHLKMITMIDDFVKKYFKDDDIIFVSHDEVILKISPENNENVKLTLEMFSEINEKFHMPVKNNFFRTKKLGKGSYLKTIYKVDNDSNLEVDYKTLWGVPKTKYYLYFKKEILQEPIDPLDIIFEHEGSMAYWKI